MIIAGTFFLQPIAEGNCDVAYTVLVIDHNKLPTLLSGAIIMLSNGFK